MRPSHDTKCTKRDWKYGSDVDPLRIQACSFKPLQIDVSGARKSVQKSLWSSLLLESKQNAGQNPRDQQFVNLNILEVTLRMSSSPLSFDAVHRKFVYFASKVINIYPQFPRLTSHMNMVCIKTHVYETIWKRERKQNIALCMLTMDSSWENIYWR